MLNDVLVPSQNVAEYPVAARERSRENVFPARERPVPFVYEVEAPI